MIIQTTRFGQVEIAEADILDFSEGLLGFGHLHRFVLLDDPSDEIFAWLQSCEAPEIAFPVLEPELFAPEYKVEISKSDLEILHLQATQEGRFMCIVTIPMDPTQMTANMKAPLVINARKKLARQCVMQDNSLQIREPIFTRLQQRVVQNPALSFKAKVQDMGAVKVIRRSSEAEL